MTPFSFIQRHHFVQGLSLFLCFLFFLPSIATAATAPSAPSALTASATTSQVTLKWTDNSSTESGFIVERSTSSVSGFSQIANLASNSTLYIDSSVSPSLTYYYRVSSYLRVKGRSRLLVSLPSNVASATVPVLAPAPAPAPAPTFAIVVEPHAINLTSTSATIEWTLSEPATGQVQYGLTSSYGQSTTGEPTFNYSTHRQVLSGLTSGVTYHYRVISKNSLGQQVVSIDHTFTTLAVAPISGPVSTPVTTQGRIFYVSTTGSDSNPGTLASPWKTFCKANSMVAPGDTVRVLSGVYDFTTESSCGWEAAVFFSRGGTSTAPVTYISDVKWGAKIRSSGQYHAVRIEADFITFADFDVAAGANEPAYPNGKLYSGITSTASGSRIIGNRVHDIPNDFGCANWGGAGIMSGVHDRANPTATIQQEISNNIVFKVGTAANCSSSVGIVHGIYGQTVGIKIMNNIIYNNLGGAGIALNHCYTGVTVSNNLLWKNASHPIVLSDNVDTGCTPNTGSVVNNNIIRDSIAPTYSRGQIYDRSGGNDTASNNLFFNNLGNNSSGITEVGSRTIDPMMVNFQLDGLGDYHLKAGSPAIDAGTSSRAPSFDFDFLSRPRGAGFDIGPFEY